MNEETAGFHDLYQAALDVCDFESDRGTTQLRALRAAIARIQDAREQAWQAKEEK